MTNDEILKQVISPDHALLYPEFLRAMDAAREDEAVAYGNWISDNCNDDIGRYDMKALYQLYKQKL